MAAARSSFYEPRAKAFFEPIGRYVFYFGMLERDIDEGLCCLLRVPYYNIGQAIFSQINSLVARVNLLGAVARSATTDPSKLEQMTEMIDRLEKQNTFRNHLVHGAWTAHFEHPGGEKGWQKMGLSRRFNASGWNVTASEIASNCALLETLSGEIQHLIREICIDRDTGRFPPPGISAGVIPGKS
jgi:hypothetical protein